MALPQAVVRRAEAASRLITDAASARSGTTTTPGNEPAAVDVATLQKQVTDANAALAKAQQALDTLQGKYNAEVPRAAEQLRKAQADLKAANDRAAKLEADLKKKYEAGDITSLSPEARKLLGEETVRGMVTIAREIADTTVNARLQPLADQFDQFQRMSEEGFFVTLDEFVPDWTAVNDDAKFDAWLREKDPATQRTRMQLLKSAEAARQGYRAAEIFKAFKEGREIGLPKANPADDPLARRVEPGAGGGGAADERVDDKGKKIWLQSEIRTFYDDRRRGKFHGKDAEARQLEEDIFAAQRESRVRPG